MRWGWICLLTWWSPLNRGLTILSNNCRVPVKVIAVFRDEVEVPAARPGENLRLRIQGIEEEDISTGELAIMPASGITRVA